MKQSVPFAPKITFLIYKITPINLSLNNEEELVKNKEELFEIDDIQTQFDEQAKIKFGIQTNQPLSIFTFLEKTINSFHNINNIDKKLNPYIEIERNDSFETRNSEKDILDL